MAGTARNLLIAATLAVLTGLSGVGRPLANAEPPVEPARANPEAVALDQKLIAEAKEGSEILANLTYLSDIIGPRLTGSANLKRANEWAASQSMTRS